MEDIFEHIAEEASRLALSNQRTTMTSRVIQTAARLLLPREMGKPAVSEATKAAHELPGHHLSLYLYIHLAVTLGNFHPWCHTDPNSSTCALSYGLSCPGTTLRQNCPLSYDQPLTLL